jgi:hypothetical protein
MWGEGKLTYFGEVEQRRALRRTPGPPPARRSGTPLRISKEHLYVIQSPNLQGLGYLFQGQAGPEGGYRGLLLSDFLLAAAVRSGRSAELDWDFQGKSYTVPELEFHECPVCGERVFDRESSMSRA